MAAECADAARDPEKARRLLEALCESLLDYRPVVHSQTVALEKVFERALASAELIT